MRPIVPFIGFVCLVLLLGVLLLRDHAGQPEAARSFPALQLKALDGKAQWSTESLYGQVTVINVFASWCASCAAEMPELAVLKKDYPEVQFFGIAWNDKPEMLNGWLKKHGRPFHSVWLDPEGNATITLGLKGVPETLVIDREGMIRYRLAGPLTTAVREKVLAPLLIELSEQVYDAP